MPENATNGCTIWRAAGGDATRGGRFPKPMRLEPRRPRCLPTRGAVQAAVVFDSAGTAFVADMAGAVQAFSSKGELRWRTELPGGISASPVVHPSDARVYVGTHMGSVLALDTATGASLWEKRIPTKSDPRILSDLLYWPQTDAVVLSSWGGRYVALDSTSGNELFSWDAGIFPYAGAAADGTGNLRCLRSVAKQGVEFLRFSVKGEEVVLHRLPEGKRGARRTLVAAAPLVDEERGVAYFLANGDEGSLLHAWSTRTDALLWSRPLPHCVQATPGLRTDGAILVADLGGMLHAVGPEGDLRFRYSAECEYLLAGGVIEAGGTCFIGDPLGVLRAIDEQGRGKQVFEARRAIQGRPSFDPSGSLYVPGTDRTVYVFSAKPSRHAMSPVSSRTAGPGPSPPSLEP